MFVVNYISIRTTLCFIGSPSWLLACRLVEQSLTEGLVYSLNHSGDWYSFWRGLTLKIAKPPDAYATAIQEQSWLNLQCVIY